MDGDNHSTTVDFGRAAGCVCVILRFDSCALTTLVEAIRELKSGRITDVLSLGFMHTSAYINLQMCNFLCNIVRVHCRSSVGRNTRFALLVDEHCSTNSQTYWSAHPSERDRNKLKYELNESK